MTPIASFVVWFAIGYFVVKALGRLMWNSDDDDEWSSFA